MRTEWPKTFYLWEDCNGNIRVRKDPLSLAGDCAVYQFVEEGEVITERRYQRKVKP